MDNKNKKRDRTWLGSVVVAVSLIGAWAWNIHTNGHGYKVFAIPMWLGYGLALLGVVKLVRGLRSGESAHNAEVPDRFWLAYAISSALANAYIILIWARPALGFIAHLGFFVGDVEYSGIIGAVALLSFIMLTIYLYYQKYRQPKLLVMMLIGVVVPLAPLIIVIAKKQAEEAASRKRYGLIFMTVFVLFISYAFFYFYAVRNPIAASKPAASTDTASIDQLVMKVPALSATVKAGEFDAPVGACANLVGPRSNPSLSVESCDKAAYRIVQRVETPRQCPGDVDDQFYINPPGGQWTACLDYAWSTKDCLSIAKGASATRVACNDPNVANREKPTRLMTDSTSSADCPDGGFTHPVRRFTVCSETQK